MESVLAVALLLAITGLLTMTSCYREARRREEALKEQLGEWTDPEQELLAIRRLGDEGRRQVRMLAAEMNRMLRATRDQVK